MGEFCKIHEFRLLIASVFAASAVQASSIVYQGKAGAGVGKHIVFLASDHEYRTEETCPALARILVKHHGFKCTVIFGVDKDGSMHRVFHSTQGAPEDILDDNYRRLIFNGILWAAGMEKEIKPAFHISFVGPYQPNTFSFGRHAEHLKPSDLAGWDSPIMPARAKEAPAR